MQIQVSKKVNTNSEKMSSSSLSAKQYSKLIAQMITNYHQMRELEETFGHMKI